MQAEESYGIDMSNYKPIWYLAEFPITYPYFIRKKA